MKGPEPVKTTGGALKSLTGCEIKYRRFEPESNKPDVIALLGHGFLRSAKRMEIMARHLASWGIDVVTIDFCNSKLWAGNHDKNAADMVAVSQKLKSSGSIYLGFSAGGLAALVASNLDSGARAYFGLDMVDHRNLGQLIAPQLKIPLYGLLADPSSCNADCNALQVYAKASQAFILKIVDATHCHFELPLDTKCTIICGKGEKRNSRKEIQRTILGLTTAFLLWQTGVDPSGASWWAAEGHNFQSLVEAGYIVLLKNSPQSSLRTLRNNILR
jgi:dienelactone hydrolase